MPSMATAGPSASPAPGCASHTPHTPIPPLQILAYHVVPDQALTAAQLTDGQQLPTLDGSETVTVSMGEEIIAD